MAAGSRFTAMCRKQQHSIVGTHKATNSAIGAHVAIVVSSDVPSISGIRKLLAAANDTIDWCTLQKLVMSQQ